MFPGAGFLGVRAAPLSEGSGGEEPLGMAPPAPRPPQAVTRRTALIVNLPGSVNGATECLRAVLHLIPHALELLGEPHVERHP